MPLIASFSIIGLDDGPSVGRFVKIAVDELKGSGVKYKLGPMETSFEARDIDHAFSVIKKAHEAVVNAGAKRVVINMKLDQRFDRELTMEQKISRANGTD